ncbi:MAG: isoprenylcysteine carboxylmethyltransferase family protein [Caldiserica bacterium]|nr:isoprenylcysteine carboxylmethyltransferase family protein [Caldisericota bacterium]
MTAESIFRMVFWILVLSIVVFDRIIPALKAKKSGAKLRPDNETIKNEGRRLFAFRVMLGIILASFLGVYTFYPELTSRLQIHLPLGIRWFGVVIAAMGVIFWSCAQAVLDRNWSGNLKIQKGHKLVTAGPYGKIRHPIYAGTILWASGLALFTANVFFILMALLTIVFIFLRVTKEEKMLIEHFGDEYIEYMDTTGRYFPKFKHNK